MRPHAIVLGGTRGLGRAVVRALRDDGYRVSAVGRREPAPGDRRRGVRHFALDLTDAPACRAAYDEMVRWGGGLHALVALQRFRAGGDAWEGELRTTLGATRDAIDALSPRFDRAGGAIVLVGSIASHLVATEQPLGYHVAKAGLRQMARYYAVALGRRRIRVNVVSPAAVLKEESRRFYLANRGLQSIYRRATPLGRMGTAEEIAQVLVFLCGPRAGFVTGQDLVVDGGLSLLAHEALARTVGGEPHPGGGRLR